MCVCAWTFPIEVKLVLFQHITGTVSNEATSDMGYWIWSIHRICILRWTLPWWLKTCCFVWFFCLVLLFLFSSYCFHSWNMEWEYVAPRHLVCQRFVQVRGWVGDLLPKALKLCFGVSFGYRFGIVLSPWPSRKNRLQIRIITVTHASSRNK